MYIRTYERQCDMSVFLELLRIILIFLISGEFFSTVLSRIYKSMGVSQFEWFGGLAVLVLLFVTYRNKWQFKGWYKGEGKVILSQKTTKLLISFSVLLLILPPLIHYFVL